MVNINKKWPFAGMKYAKGHLILAEKGLVFSIIVIC